MLEGLRSQIYQVADLAAAKAWYTKLLGKPPYFEEPFYVGGYELGLQPSDNADAGQAKDAVTYWGVPDAEAAYVRLLALGAKEYQPVQEVGGGIKLGAALTRRAAFWASLKTRISSSSRIKEQNAMTTITLTPELETALNHRAQAQGTTPELLALDGLRQLYTTPERDREEPPEPAGETLFDFLKDYIGVLHSSEQIEGGARLSEDCGAKFAEGMEQKRKEGRL